MLPSHLEPIDLGRILMIDNTTASPPGRMTTNASRAVEFRGDAIEIETTLAACLKIGKFDRALALLRQLGQIYKAGSEELVAAYNLYLEGMVMGMARNRSHNHLEAITRLVEVDMRNAGVEPNARTYALKIKSALSTLTGSRRDRTVRRYWELAKRYDFENEVASLRDIISDHDLGKLSEICPMKLEVQLDGVDDTVSEPIEVNAGDMIAHRAAIEVRETAQKGLGLSSLKKSLSLFTDKLHLESRDQFKGTVEEREVQYAEARQSRLETDAIESAIKRWRSEHEKMTKIGVNSNIQKGRLGPLLWQWHEILAQKIRKELELVEVAERKTKRSPQERLRCEYGPFLRLMKPEHIAAMTTIVVVQLMNQMGVTNAVKLVRLVVEIGRALELEMEAEQFRAATVPQDRQKRIDQDCGSADVSLLPSSASTSEPRASQSRPTGRLYSKKFHWSPAIHAKVGAILCEHLFDAAKITVSKEDPKTKKMLHIAQTVFRREFLYQDGRRFGIVTLHAEIVDMLVAQPAGDLIAKQLPMISKPKPWKGFYDGGFLESQTSFLRVKGNEGSQREYAEAAAARGDLDQLCAGIDVLGRTAWKINRNVFNVMLEAWNSGEAIANLPPVDKAFPAVEKPTDPNDRTALYKYYKTLKEVENERSGLHSNRCFQNFQMEIAKAYLDETFYLPHNIDFRGRAYPIPPYFNQMGADNCRGLLLFAKGRALGPSGLRWLKIHLSNVYGYDKASLRDRESFPMEHLQDVLDSTTNPLQGNKWWLTAEDPWQCLATCFELKSALEMQDPSQFVSHLPIHQDGSCNGLQHYAALGGDLVGARQVNLEPGDKPADVYTGVAELVKAEIEEDAIGGDELARDLVGKVTRKIVKQTVMTNVYGVTFLGAIRQVRRQVDEILPEFSTSTPPRSGIAATYIARKIFRALGAMFSGAHHIQYWLGDCANRISTSLSPNQLQKILEMEQTNGLADAALAFETQKTKRPLKAGSISGVAAFRSGVIWTTPLKLPVVQPYRINKGQSIKTNLQEITLAQPTIADSVDKRKQLQAFPPNFIHSLDATHMALSALKSEEMGLTFSAVHDSFWTHAADVGTLSELLRDAFIRMHSEDIVGRLAAEFKLRYQGHIYLASIHRGSRLAAQIREYRRALYSQHTAGNEHKRRYLELVREIKRQNLLRSDEAAERQQGQEMVTAASLFLKYDGEQALIHKDSLGETAIGSIPKETSEETLNKALHARNAAMEVDMPQTLQPLMQDAAADDVEGDNVEGDNVATNVEGEIEDAKAEATPVKKASKAYNKYTWIWLPLTFRDVPKKVCCPSLVLTESSY